MTEVNKEKKGLIRLAVLIGSLFLIQGINRYFGSHLIWFENFRGVLFLSRFVVPILLLVFVLKIPFKDLGLKFQSVSKGWWIFAIVILIAVPIIQSLVLLDDSYQKYYAFYTNSSIPVLDRLRAFGLFTLSTFFGWEFLHRAYCLFGLRYLLRDCLGIDEEKANWISILWTSSFEVFFHFQKPALEAFGLMFAAPIWSWISLKTKSVWFAVGIHFYIEALFIFFMIWSAG